jgi:threonine/homoserine/homoserine lactone efflux protein
MSASFFIRGLVIGFSLAAPVGPIGLLCIRRSIAEGRLVGFVSGLGAATADASYGAIAAFGLTAVSTFLVAQKLWLGVFGGAFLCYLGVRTFVSPTADREAKGYGVEREGLSRAIRAYGSTFVLTLTNPVTILSFIPIFAGLGLGLAADYRSAASTVLGVFAGSALWWLILSNGVALIGARLNSQWMRAVNRISGTLIAAFGIFAIVTAFRR